MKDLLDVGEPEQVSDELRPYLELAMQRVQQFMGLSEYVAEHGDDEDVSFDQLLAPTDQPTHDPTVITLSIREAAAKLGTSTDTLRKVASLWVATREAVPEGPAPYRTTGDGGHRTWRFPVEGLWPWWHEATELVHSLAHGDDDPGRGPRSSRSRSGKKRSSGSRARTKGKGSEVPPLPSHEELERQRRG